MMRTLTAFLVAAGAIGAPAQPMAVASNAACAAISRFVVARMGDRAAMSACDAPDLPGDWTGVTPDSSARVGALSCFTLTGVRATTGVRALVQVDAPHAMAVQTLVRGRVISAADIAAETGPMAGARFDRAPLAADLTGARIAKVIEAGAVVQSLDVVLPFLVKPGEQVLAIVRIGAVEVTAAMTAVDGGSIGDEIRMSARDKKRVLRGKVVGPGRVEVSYEC